MPRPLPFPRKPAAPAVKAAAPNRPVQLGPLLERGIALHQQGQLEQARQLYAQVLAVQPRQFDALHLSGVIAAQTQNLALAVELISQAIEVNSQHASAHSNLGNALRALGRHEEAAACYARSLAVQPDFPAAHFNQGIALLKAKRFQEAADSLARAVALDPGNAEAHCNRGNALLELKRFDEAVPCYDAAIAVKPDDAEPHANRGFALRELGQLQAAVDSCDRALALKPDYLEALITRGIALRTMGRLHESLASYDRAMALKPDYHVTYSNRGNVLKDLMRLDEAIASFDRAIALRPGHASAYWNKSLALLLRGEFAAGWPLYEWRWKNLSNGIAPRNFAQPQWLGQDELAGKTVLLHAEQGLGDTIQFCRYAARVQARGARVVLEVPQPLLRLLGQLQGVDQLVAQGQPLPAFDLHCPLLSLPLAFNTDLQTIPSPGPYLRAPQAQRALWAQRLGPRSRPRVGLVWSGSPAHRADQQRSVALSQMLAHLPAGLEYISLQREVRPGDQAALASSAVRHYGEQLQDFADTAALCELLDVVVSVDTSVAHLAGALGKPTWVLLPHAPDWRWLQQRSDSPWYACMRLYRQGAEGLWPPVLAQVGQDLQRQLG